MGRAALAQGHFAEAVTAFERASALSDNPRYRSWLAHAYARAGRQADARRILDDFRTPPAGCAYDAATIHAALGDRVAALEWLERAYRDREPALRYLVLDERLESLRSEPRFIVLARRVGLPVG
jgi:tetratricopeptide (TPR) repeat protein